MYTRIYILYLLIIVIERITISDILRHISKAAYYTVHIDQRYKYELFLSKYMSFILLLVVFLLLNVLSILNCISELRHHLFPHYLIFEFSERSSYQESSQYQWSIFNDEIENIMFQHCLFNKRIKSMQIMNVIMCHTTHTKYMKNGTIVITIMNSVCTDVYLLPR